MPWLAIAIGALLAIALGGAAVVAPAWGLLPRAAFLDLWGLHVAVAAALPVAALGVLADGTSDRALPSRRALAGAWFVGWLALGTWAASDALGVGITLAETLAVAWWTFGLLLAASPARSTTDRWGRVAVLAVLVVALVAEAARWVWPWSFVPGLLAVAAWPVLLVVVAARRRSLPHALQLLAWLAVGGVLAATALVPRATSTDLHLHDTLWDVGAAHTQGTLLLLGLLAAVSVWRAPWWALLLQWATVLPMALVVASNLVVGLYGMPRRYAVRPVSAVELLPVAAAAALVLVAIAWALALRAPRPPA